MTAENPAESAPKGPGKTKEGPEETPKRTTSRSAPFVLPGWVPQKLWLAFDESRTRMRHPLTDSARVLLVRKLDSLKRVGHDPTDVLEAAVQLGWRGLFPPPKDWVHAGGSNGSTHDNRSAAERRRDNGIAALQYEHPEFFGRGSDGPPKGVDDRFVPEPGGNARNPTVLDQRLV